MTDLEFFGLLKKKVGDFYRLKYPDCHLPIQEWKGKEIKRFRTSMMELVQGQVSEKWFYTHIKNDHDKLPRIDVLNLLAAYAGYEDWEVFKSEIQVLQPSLDQEEVVEKEAAPLAPKYRKKLRFQRFLMKQSGLGLVFVLLLIVGFISIAINWNRKGDVRFCFVSKDNQEPVKLLRAEWLIEGESPRKVRVDSTTNCIELEAVNGAQIKLVVQAEYHHIDTIIRTVPQSNYKEKVELRQDDYAIMMHYFSAHKIEDWKKRRNRLDKMIAPNAQFVQVYGAEELSIGLYNKEEFIDKLTIPVNNLKDIFVLETKYNEQDELVYMRFR